MAGVRADDRDERERGRGRAQSAPATGDDVAAGLGGTRPSVSYVEPVMRPGLGTNVTGTDTTDRQQATTAEIAAEVEGRMLLAMTEDPDRFTTPLSEMSPEEYQAAMEWAY